MNRREFTKFCLVGIAAAAVPFDVLGGPPTSVINQISGLRFPRKFACGISGNLSNQLGDRAIQASLAKFDAVVLNIYAPIGMRYNGRTWQDAVKNIRSLNPDILVGTYVVIEETKNDSNRASNVDLDKYLKVQKEDWWLRTASGSLVDSFPSNCAINGSRYSAPDAAGLRWPQWLAKRDFDKFFAPARLGGKGLDIWYIDNVRSYSLYVGDWNKDGVNDPPTGAIAMSAYRQMNLDYFAAARALAPYAILMGNAPDDLSMYPQALDAGFNEAMFGVSWSPGGYPPWGLWHDGDWTKVMRQYNTQFKNVTTELVVFQAQGAVTDYQLFRYALCSCLLNNGYLSYVDKAVGCITPPWFDEYDYNLGMPTSIPPAAPWNNGVWRRDFQYGVSLVNPTNTSQPVMIEAGFHRLSGRQDPLTNNGNSATGRLLIPSRDGIILKRN